MKQTSRVHAALMALFAALLLLPAPMQAQQPQRPTSTPYTGPLSIFDYKDRDRLLQPDRVMDMLKLHAGSNVADIGAGSGWFTVRAAARVAPGGTVYAEDINPVAIKTIDERAQKAGLKNVHTVLGTPDDPRLPTGSVNAVLMLKVYHEIAHPAVLLANLKPDMRPGAKLGIIDRNGNGTDHGLNEDVVKKEVEQAGFHEVGRYTFTKADGQDYFLIFQKN
jgi:ubiquinone/menaquinone biosynthesis C-methylase UbiE